MKPSQHEIQNLNRNNAYSFVYFGIRRSLGGFEHFETWNLLAHEAYEKSHFGRPHTNHVFFTTRKLLPKEGPWERLFGRARTWVLILRTRKNIKTPGAGDFPIQNPAVLWWFWFEYFQNFIFRRRKPNEATHCQVTRERLSKGVKWHFVFLLQVF